ncbi:hypothetical protein QTO34_012877 [Cnephaeus nilssonii]|uniref:Malonyl-CoA-acyl carrier protein transacylase, mitochondrial n=1 Tax=Cnephaeus nilssonii TaxID=3371016 RepID=A0AA40HAJ9_CNENI|nr:hypothetical protein QTO34_012877 [Eptesicus nilssonii]
MLSVLGRPQTKFTSACLEAREHCKTLGMENPVCEVANYLFPDCRVISGHLEVSATLVACLGTGPWSGPGGGLLEGASWGTDSGAALTNEVPGVRHRLWLREEVWEEEPVLDRGCDGAVRFCRFLSLPWLTPPPVPLQALQFLQKNSSRFHFRRTKMLPVSGAFHTRLMEPAVEPLAQVLKAIDVKRPLVSVHANVSGSRYMHPAQIQQLLVKQVVSPVKWEQTMHALYERKKGSDFPRTFEVGPGKQLGAILRSCNLQAWKSYSHVDVLEAEEAADEDLQGLQ